jgi:ATP-dependent Lhr-like helicase
MSEFASIRDYFQAQRFTPFGFQKTAWSRTEAGIHQLIQCPTGSGKTLAAAGAWIDQLLKQPKSTGLCVLYITPLRAMTRDIERALAAPLAGSGHDVLARNGDSTARERARIMRKPPAILMITPESLSVLLASTKAPEIFKHLQGVIVDEWHDLMVSKRGLQTVLCLARLRHYAPHFVLTGVSATLADPERALRALLPVGETGQITRAEISREIQLRVIEDTASARIPWAGHLGLTLLKEVARDCIQGETTLLFANTRNQAEQWYQALSIVRADLQVALHHGSLAPDTRNQVETGLKAGTLDLVVATSALDLGVDFQAVERIIQVGSPRAVSRLIQRAGRARHRPGAHPTVILVPTNRLHLHEYAALADALDDQALEPMQPAAGSLDVLLQHLVTLALQAPWDPDAMLAEIRQVDAYRTLSQEVFTECLTVLEKGSHSLTEYSAYQKLKPNALGHYAVTSLQIARRHRMSIGTIVSHAQVRVRMRRGPALGEIEESFAGRLRPGDVFRFAGKRLAMLRLQDGELIVKPAAGGRVSEVPRWTGGRLPLSETLAHRIVLAFERTHPVSPRVLNADWLAKALQKTAWIQSSLSASPQADTVLCERFRSRDGSHLLLYPFAGWLVHQALGPLLATRLARHTPATLTITVNDYGIELLSPTEEPLDTLITQWTALLHADDVVADLDHALNLTEIVRRQFRATARIAGLIFEGYPGKQKSMRALQSSAGLLFDVLSEHDPEHILLMQAKQDVLQDEFDLPRLMDTLTSLETRSLHVHALQKPSPLSLPLLIERLSARLSTERLQDRLQRMTEAFDD